MSLRTREFKMKRTGPSNEDLQQLILELRKESTIQQVGIWKRLAEELSRPARQKRVVNLSKLTRVTQANETVLVPGKVLGSGNLAHSLTIAAQSFSGSAREDVEKLKGKCLTIRELVKQNPKGKNVRIIG